MSAQEAVSEVDYLAEAQACRRLRNGIFAGSVILGAIGVITHNRVMDILAESGGVVAVLFHAENIVNKIHARRQATGDLE